MGYAFISYSSTDREFVLRMAEDLQRLGCELWLDRWNIIGRDPYWDEIQTGIEGSTHFLFVISPDSIDRTSGAYTELLHAASLRPAPIIVPVMARETPYGKLPIVVSPGKYQIHDFAHQPYDQTVVRVANTLKSNLEATAPIERYVRSQLEPHVEGQAQKPPLISCSVRTARLSLAIVVPLIAFAFAFVLFNQRNTQTGGNIQATEATSVALAASPTPRPTATLTATPRPTEFGVPTIPPTPEGGTCPATLQSRMVIGRLGRVTPGQPNRLNDRPARYKTDGSGARILTNMPGGETFIVLGGPVCNDGLAWWLVNYKGRIGYTAEGDSTGYWIEPVE